MGLTFQSTQKGALSDFDSSSFGNGNFIIALAGNPNVGKSTVFNALTGLKQHTGNWPGKTVANAAGSFVFENSHFTIVDLPGTYSILSSSKEEEIARDFICSDVPDAVLIVADATCLERNLNLVLQILEITPNCILCINLIDEAQKKRIKIDTHKLRDILNIPIITTCAAKKNGVTNLKSEIFNLSRCANNYSFSIKYDSLIEDSISIIADTISQCFGSLRLSHRFIAVKLLSGDSSIIQSIEKCVGVSLTNNKRIHKILNSEAERLAQFGITNSNLNDKIAFSIISAAEKIAQECVSFQNTDYAYTDRKIDKIITSKVFGIPIMLFMLGIIFYLSVAGANYPSQLLSASFNKLEMILSHFLILLNLPAWIHNLFLSGVFRTLTWVVSVMLPPMAIFFPLFTLLEDLGVLPRIAFNLDGFFKKCGAHGKQCLTMCMGLGCNAAGVTGTRIIDSPRERLIAIITNSFVPCNGRFPILITISSIFFSAFFLSASSVISAAAVLLSVIIGVLFTFTVSRILSVTLLKGTPSQFTLELPPYRKPKIAEVVYRSVFDRTLFVLARAATVAAPAGAIIWIAANFSINGSSILNLAAAFLQPFAEAIGLDGYILLSFILGLPANEIVMPILIMCYTAAGELIPLGSAAETGALLIANGWNIITAVNTLLFTILHFPCATTLLTIYKETKSFKWTLISFLSPVLSGIILCFLTTQIYNIFI